jgi:hypothetical protein
MIAAYDKLELVYLVSDLVHLDDLLSEKRRKEKKALSRSSNNY